MNLLESLDIGRNTHINYGVVFSEVTHVGGLLLAIAGLVALAKGSWQVSELIRDGWHYLCHKNTFLYRHIHGPHHAAYSRDYQIRSWKRYRKDRLTHAISECLLMVVATFLLAIIAFQMIDGWWEWGSLYGVIHSFDELGRAVAGAFCPELGRKLDSLHISGQLIEAPRTDRVNSAYHLPHHDLDPMSAYSGVSPLFDKLMGTARSYRRLTFGIVGDCDGFSGALIEVLRQEGSTIEFLPLFWDSLASEERRKLLEGIDVLVIGDMSKIDGFESDCDD